MTGHSQDHSTSNHIATMIAKGEVRPSEGPCFFPRPIKAQPGKSAAEYVSDSRC